MQGKRQIFLGGSYTYYNFKYDSFVFQDRTGTTYDFSGKKLYYLIM